MEKQSKDLRVQKTYRALSLALEQLMREKPLKEITVNEICERAMVRRATFYAHFADKQELFIFVFKELLNEFSQKAEAMRSTTGGDSFYGIILLLLDYMEANTAMFYVNRDSDAYLTAWDLVMGACAEEFKNFLLTMPAADLPNSAEVTAQMLAGATIQGIKWWLAHKSQMEKADMAVQLERFLTNSLLM